MRAPAAILAVASVLVCCAICGADDPREAAVVTLRSGGLSVELQRAHSWNIEKITFRGVPVVTRTGASGAIACIPVAGGWVGSAHTQGGVEQIEEATLIVDGEFRELEDGAVYTGERLILKKRSMLDKLKLNATLTLADGVLNQRHELTATEDVVVTRLYPFMFCISARTTSWIAETRDGEFEEGQFGTGGDLVWHDDWVWTGAHIPQRDTGVVIRHLARPADARSFTGYWDQERYHKLYVRWDQPEPWPEQVTLSGEMALTCLQVSDDEWRQAAREAAEELVAE